ncbi:hypothetical protein [Gimesia aquarii]|uniref:hypothetical protein n=1 Tax=Gimesia aquarii TaxID=2527964 RepID=UPI0011A1AA93|nr:hypothetical protein [Gimesia aquarii]
MSIISAHPKTQAPSDSLSSLDNNVMQVLKANTRMDSRSDLPRQYHESLATPDTTHRALLRMSQVPQPVLQWGLWWWIESCGLVNLAKLSNNSLSENRIPFRASR